MVKEKQTSSHPKSSIPSTPAEQEKQLELPQERQIPQPYL
jgi:hypothetical protein